MMKFQDLRLGGGGLMAIFRSKNRQLNRTWFLARARPRGLEIPYQQTFQRTGSRAVYFYLSVETYRLSGFGIRHIGSSKKSVFTCSNTPTKTEISR